MTRFHLLSGALAGLVLLGGLLLHGGPSFAAEEIASIRMWDNCDPDSFNAAVGPGTCIPGQHGTELFPLFIEEVTLDRIAGAWRFGSNRYVVHQGEESKLDNRGGELHTFTKVAKFGGGVVPILNQLSGNPVPAPECLVPENPSNIFVEAGTVEDGPVAGSAEMPVGTNKYMCCIHPWMRTTVIVK